MERDGGGWGGVEGVCGVGVGVLEGGGVGVVIEEEGGRVAEVGRCKWEGGKGLGKGEGEGARKAPLSAEGKYRNISIDSYT